MKNFVLLLIFLFLIGCKKDDIDDIIVKYEVSCIPMGFTVTYYDKKENTKQGNSSTNQWSIDFPSKKGNSLYLSAQADNANADIVMRIYIAAVVLKYASGNGNYIVVTTSGEVP